MPQKVIEVSAAEPHRAMTLGEAASLLRMGQSTLQYHIRKGRIRRVKIPGSARAVGVVAADVLALVNPDGGYDTRVIHAKG